jgi:hypothetical protein
MKLYFPALLLVLTFSSCASAPHAQEREPSSGESILWERNDGIEATTIEGKLIVIRADTQLNSIELINPPESSPLTVSQVASRRGLAVVINAAMFAKDYITSIGYMRNFETINNPKIASKMSGFLMFNPKNAGSPPVKIGSKQDIAEYNTAFQSYRMWSESEGILWKEGASIFHQVGLVGVDAQNRILFFFHPELVDVHELVARILELKLNLRGLLYLDGGNHATLSLSREIRSELGNSWNTWLALPNLLGIKTSAK